MTLTRILLGVALVFTPSCSIASQSTPEEIVCYEDGSCSDGTCKPGHFCDDTFD